MSTTNGSTVIVQQLDERMPYSGGLRKLPQLVERIDSVRCDLDAIGAQALDLAEEAERLGHDLGELAEFVGARVAINRARERRRERHRGNGHSGNGHIQKVVVS